MIASTGMEPFKTGHEFTRPRDFPYWTLELTTDGVMSRRSGNAKRFRPQRNHVFYLSPPGLPYMLRGINPGHELWVIFQPRDEVLPFLGWSNDEFGTRVLVLPEKSLGGRLIDLFKRVHQLVATRTAEADFLAENALECLIVEAWTAHSREHAAQRDERIERVVSRMTATPERPYTVVDLARIAECSESRFAHLFREQMSESPMAFLERLRLENAQQLLLRSDRQIQEIARDVGFEDPYYFSTRFRAFSGKSPRAWRQDPSPHET